MSQQHTPAPAETLHAAAAPAEQPQPAGLLSLQPLGGDAPGCEGDVCAF